jgi:methyl-accepting chemotaxis protein
MGGTPWQIDLHMLVFAVLATLAVLGDWRAMVAATLVIAIHHLGAGLLRPAWVLPTGADLPRALLHTGIVVAEAAVLIPLAIQLERMIVGQARSHAAAEAAEQGAAAIRAAVIADQATVLAALGAGLEALSGGDLTHRLRDGFPDCHEGLRRDFNQALRSLDAALAKVAAATQGITHGAGHIRLADDRRHRFHRAVYRTPSAFRGADQRPPRQSSPIPGDAQPCFTETSRPPTGSDTGSH